MSRYTRAQGEAKSRQYQQALEDLHTLQTELKKMLPNTPVASRNSSFLKVKAILNRGIAFSLLDDDFQNTAPSYESDSVHVCAIIECLSSFSLWYEVTGRPEYASLAQKKPLELAEVFHWVDLIHPMNGRLIRTTGYERVIGTLTGLFATITRKRIKEFVQFAWSEPHAITLILGLWLNYPTYIELGTEDSTGVAGTGTIAALALFEALDEEEAGEALVVEQLLRLEGGSRRRVLRRIAEQTDFIRQLDLHSSWRFLWKIHFGMVSTLIHSRQFYDIVAPRALFDSTLAGVRVCLQTPDEEAVVVGVEKAFEMFRFIICNTSHTMNLVRAIKMGVFDVVVDIEHIWGGVEKDHDFGDLDCVLESNLVIPSVLRAFHARHADLLEPAGRSELRRIFIAKRFGNVVRSFRTMWAQYTHAKETRSWKTIVPCSNTITDAAHEAQVRACPCGEAFYCSDKCQRDHWRVEHRLICHRDDGVWGYGGSLSLDDAVFLTVTSLNVIKRHDAEIKAKLAASLTGDPKPTYGAVRIELNDAPSRDGDFEWEAFAGVDEEDTEDAEDLAATRATVIRPPADMGEHKVAASVMVLFNLGELYPEHELPVKYDFLKGVEGGFV
ncbi:hypothetical protein BD626DRAFT_438114 [Schizophyllum amplum]|uniref:MYND-type domain-containing protein n=1 Tax=Schizophyllum amplum TaxID=97359 RepID=A0A550C146_9AGAR|nr:hypothetical protein BD626DRAFT_438114 [Auriculariopsis ampla]